MDGNGIYSSQNKNLNDAQNDILASRGIQQPLTVSGVASASFPAERLSVPVA